MVKKIFIIIIVIVSLLLVSAIPALARVGNYNSRVIPSGTIWKYMESNSWYWTTYPYLAAYSRHYLNWRYTDTASYGQWYTWRAHAVHWHAANTGMVSGKHVFYDGYYWYVRYSLTSWIW